MECLFCKIINKEINSKIVYEDEKCLAFEDINPQAPTHILIVPKKHIGSLREMNVEDENLIGHILYVISKIALERKLENGFRVVVNDGKEAGQSIFHLHFHLLGGRILGWPPG
ncbi:MAG: histidine triad nucleotide-binding protein [Candidatus Hydrothermales bacterium]